LPRRDAVLELLLDVIGALKTPYIYIGPGWACLPWNQLVLLDSNSATSNVEGLTVR
jgi:hypothetical protein